VKTHAQTFGVTGAFFFLGLCLWGTLFVSRAEPQGFEKAPIILQASRVLPKELLSGPSYKVKETVTSDGFINVYEIESPYGHLNVESTELLRKRAAELNALSRIEALKGTSVYMDAAKAAALGPVQTAKALVTEPVETVKGIGSGIGNFFGKVSSAATSKDPDKDSAMSSILGQAAFKREYAYEFGVDPYTNFEPLKKALGDLAWTAAAGGLTVKAAFMAIPGATGTVVGYAGTSDTMRNLVRDKTPPELEKINRESLRSMGVDDGLANLFLTGTSYSPQEKTFLVGALASTGASHRRIFVELAAMDCEEPVALFMRIRAELMAQYFRKMRSVDRFVSAAGVPLLLTKEKGIVGLFPLDYVAWTAGFARKAMEISSAIEKMPSIKGKELWITGTVDPVARKALEERGWKVQEKIEGRLFK
jgi:hypothetical protein